MFSAFFYTKNWKKKINKKFVWYFQNSFSLCAILNIKCERANLLNHDDDPGHPACWPLAQGTTVQCSLTELYAAANSCYQAFHFLYITKRIFLWLAHKLWCFSWRIFFSCVLSKKRTCWTWKIRNPQFITILSEKGKGMLISVIILFDPWPWPRPLVSMITW